MIDFMVLVIAGGLGWSLARAALCAVAATQEAVQSQRATGLGMQLLALSATAVVLLGLSWWIDDLGRLPTDSGGRLVIGLAAVCMALGAMINGGCYLGSVMYLGRGKANFLFSLVGIAVAARVGLPERFGLAAVPSLRPHPPGTVLAVAAGLAALLILVTVRALQRAHGSTLNARVGQTLLAGVFAGALMVHAPGWGYGTLLNAIGHLGRVPFDLALVAPPAALFAGAVISCIAAGTWAPARPTLIGATRCLAGGFIMESAAHCIPGGNDVLLLWAIPGLGGYGLYAYSLLLGTMLLVWRLIGARASNL